MNRYVYCIAIMLFNNLLTMGCGPTEESSELQHIFGETRYDADFNFSCQSNANDFPEATSYIEGLVNHITSSNSATFYGQLTSNNFCVDVIQDPDPNASAHRDGTIQFRDSLLKLVKNEAELAAVLSHELAHLTMAHMIRPRNAPFMNDPEYTRLKKKLDDLFEEDDARAEDYADKLLIHFNKRITSFTNQELEYLVEDVERYLAGTESYSKAILYFSLTDYFAEELQVHGQSALNKHYGMAAMSEINEVIGYKTEIDRTESEIAAREEAIGGSKGFARNWKEEEADEVGFELYLRAGYAKNQYSRFFKSFASLSSEPEDCQQYLDENEVPLRGAGSHPENCWRIYNIDVSETSDHKNDYKQFEGNTMIERTAGELQDIVNGL